ncbi:MAG: cation:proton antiporter [Syntrophomonadaceae bacterium]|nr:cation:proton antiporter [Syntrophomonadaceae bacterium]
MEFPLLNEILVIFGLAITVLFICHRLKIPAIVGYLLTGILAGPHGLALVKSVEGVQSIAELGVIFLLFNIGLEFSFTKLLDIKKTALIGGTVQVGLSIVCTFIIARLLGISANQALFLGFLISLSSTAIVLKQMGERAELDTPHGKINLGILIYQDIIIVPMMLFTPLLAFAGASIGPVSILLAKAASLVILVVILAIYAVPNLLYHIARTQSRELFLLSIIVICFSVAWLTSSAGLSLALGAFLAGLIIAESEYSHQALASIVPFIYTFTSLFFVSVGMLLNINIVLQNLGIIAVLTLALLLGKGLIASAVTIMLGYPLRTAVIVGFSLCQIGEFSFILSQTGIENGLISGALYQGFLAASVLTMMLTPFLMAAASRIAGAICNWPLSERLLSGRYPWMVETDEDSDGKEDHLVIIGYGVNGKNISRAAFYAGIPYIILEINPERVREEKQKGQPIYYGDAAHEIVLKKAKIEAARVAVIAISDPVSTRRITYMIRSLNPGIHIIVRTRFVADMQDLHRLGADDVIPEEYETSVEIFTRVLTKYLVPRDEIEEYIERIREEDYEMFRSISWHGLDFHKLKTPLADIDVVTLKVGNYSEVVGKTLSEVDFRNKYGVSIIAIYREKETISNPGAEDMMQAGDCLVVLGESWQIRNAARIIE